MSSFWCALGRMVLDETFLNHIEVNNYLNWNDNEAAINPETLYEFMCNHKLILSRFELGEINRLCWKYGKEIKDIADKAKKFTMKWPGGPWKDEKVWTFLGCCMTDNLLRAKCNDQSASDKTFQPFQLDLNGHMEIVHLIVDIKDEIKVFETQAWDPPCRTGVLPDGSYLHHSPKIDDRPIWLPVDQEHRKKNKLKPGEPD